MRGLWEVSVAVFHFLLLVSQVLITRVIRCVRLRAHLARDKTATDLILQRHVYVRRLLFVLVTQFQKTRTLVIKRTEKLPKKAKTETTVKHARNFAPTVASRKQKRH